jgi:hypothetical protein
LGLVVFRRAGRHRVGVSCGCSAVFPAPPQLQMLAVGLLLARVPLFVSFRGEAGCYEAAAMHWSRSGWGSPVARTTRGASRPVVRAAG